MAKKKVYAIKEGFDFSKNERVQNKLVDSWSECQKYIKGVKLFIRVLKILKKQSHFYKKEASFLEKEKINTMKIVFMYM